MSNEQLDMVERKMDTIVASIEKYPSHLQPMVLRIYWDELNGSSQSVSNAAGTVVREQSVNGSSMVPVNEHATDWDYRRGLDQIAEQHEIDLKSPFDYVYALILSHVLQFLSPADYDCDTLTTELVNDAWRHADRDLPNRPRQPINDAVKKGLLEKAKGKPGYVLTPKGENYVKKLLADGKL